MDEKDFSRLLGRTVRLTAVGAGMLGVASLIWPDYAFGMLVGILLGGIDLVSLGLRLPLWVKAPRGMVYFLVNARFVFRLGLLAVACYFLERWVGMGVLPWATAGIFLPYITFGVEAWVESLKRR